MDEAPPPGSGNDEHGHRATKRQKTDTKLTSTLSRTHKSPATDAVEPVKAIAPTGDIVLLLCNGTRLRVHSVVLKLASPVFRAMFGPHFSEGQNLSEANPKEVPLPDDPPESMTLICEILHHQHPSSSVRSKLLLEPLVSLVHKYDLVDAMGFKVAAFLEHELPAAKEDEFRGFEEQGLLAMAYLLKDKRSFNLISREVLIFYGGSFSDFDDPFNILPSEILVALEKHRTEVLKNLDLTITTTVTTWLQMLNSMSPGCPFSHGTPDDCCRKLLAGLLANDDNILNSLFDGSVADRFEYWRNPYRKNRTVVRATSFGDYWDSWLIDHVCTQCRASDQATKALPHLLQLAVEVQYSEISGLSLETF
ncbi:hypothetical protein SLS58_006636 [Diplodia intermedia]|uniref:BTB domain-containing protein n=1 Tax=Diplodia intermedia TaxID=856260 RepID=A0ABR3TMF7_9PEZI